MVHQESVKTRVKMAEENGLMGGSGDEKDYEDHWAMKVDVAGVGLNLVLFLLCYSHCGVEVNLSWGKEEKLCNKL